VKVSSQFHEEHTPVEPSSAEHALIEAWSKFHAEYVKASFKGHGEDSPVEALSKGHGECIPVEASPSATVCADPQSSQTDGASQTAVTRVIFL